MRRHTIAAAATMIALACLVLATSAFATITPLAHYRLGEADPGATVPNVGNDPTIDSVGSLNLSRVSGPTYSAGAPLAGNSLAVHFDGIDDRYAQAATPTTVIDNFGIEAWVKSDGGTAANAVIAYNGNTGTGGWGIFRLGANYGVLYGGRLGAPFAPVTTEWTHLAVVRDTGLSTFYVNGAPVATNGTVPLPPEVGANGAGGMLVGGNPFTDINPAVAEWFDGSIDEVRVFTFNPGEFAASDLLVEPPQLEVTVVAHFKMGEDEGGVAGNGGAATLVDSVGTFDMNKTGTPAYSADTPGPGSSLAMDFSHAAADDYTRNTAILNTSENFLIEAWAKPEVADNGGITFVAFDGSGSQGLGIMQEGNVWSGLVGGVAFVTGSIPVTTEWTHLALVRHASFNGGQTTLLVDGAISAAHGATNGPAATASIGGSLANDGESFDGLIDEVYFSTLSSAGTFTVDMLHMNAALVPEPGAASLALFGVVSLLMLRRRRARA